MFYFIFQRINKKARQIAQQVKIFAAKPKNPKTYTTEGEKMVLQVVLWSLHRKQTKIIFEKINCFKGSIEKNYG